ncbi:CHAT domain-containing protein [Nannocystaceae bacterium ST9]
MTVQPSTSISPAPLRILVLHARADAHHLAAFKTAFELRSRETEIRLAALHVPSVPTCHSTITQFVLSKADAVVFLLSPAYFAEHPNWVEQLHTARSVRGGKLAVHVVVVEPVDLSRTGFYTLAGALPSNAKPCSRAGDWARMQALVGELLEKLSGRIAPSLAAASKPAASPTASKPIIRHVLCMFANPAHTDSLLLGREWRDICDVNMRAGSPLALTPVWAARIRDLQDAMLDRAIDVLHFSGHGTYEGLCFETPEGHTQYVEPERLVRVLAHYRPRCLVFNACHSADSLESVRGLVPFVIAMQGPSDDRASIEFSRSFYAALARGKDVPAAFEHARAVVYLGGDDERCRPRMLSK